MSKFILRKHVYGFTSVSNNVIKELKCDLECLGFYLYILSLPDNWEFYKTQLAKECRVGIKKVEAILRTLGSFGLVKCGQNRSEEGRFSEFYLDVYDTETLRINDLEKQGQPVGQNCRTAETVGRSGEAIKETLTKEVNNNKKEILKDIGQKELGRKIDDPISFENFWKAYPRKVKKKKSKLIWDKNKLYLLSEQIISNIRARIATEWNGKDIQFIPHPTTYLHNEQWNDEVLEMNHDRRENSVTRNMREGLERIKKLQERDINDVQIVRPEDTSTMDRAALCPF